MGESSTPHAGAAAERTVLLRIEPSAGGPLTQPVTIGLPFPWGALPDPAAGVLRDPDDRVVPIQTRPLARWPDGSVQWLLLDFLLDRAAPGGMWRLAWAPTVAASLPSTALRMAEAPRGLVVDTGAAHFHLDRTRLPPVIQAEVKGRELLATETVGVDLTDPRGRVGRPCVERLTVETEGPVRGTVRLEGHFAGAVPCRFVARCCFFAGTGLVRLRLTVHNPRRARHPGGLWDLGDPGSLWFRELALRLGLKTAARRLGWSAEAGQPVQEAESGDLEIDQDSSGGANWQSKNHVNREGRVPGTFRGYRVRVGGREETGDRASPVVGLYGPDGGVAVAVPEFWQQFPKAISVQDSALRVGLFPGQFGDLFELQGGERKTHTLWLHFGSDGPDAPALAWVHRPARVGAEPAWYARSGALPYLLPATDTDGRLEAYLGEVVDGPHSMGARREVIDEYGWRNYGDVYADHEAAYYPGPPPVISHFNNQYDVIYGAILQYLRTGDPRWADIYDPLARHVMDIDIYHTTADRAAYNGGLFWLTDHYKDAATCTHRAYSRANCRPGDRSYGGGPSNEHNYTTGLLHYHFLTGDPDAREAVLGLADWVLHMDDGRRTILGLLDEGPTGLASRTRSADYHGPGRGCGYSVNALLDAWRLTGDRGYLDKAEELIRRAIHPEDDVAARDLLNVEERWSYTVFLAVLSRYLSDKAAAGAIDEHYAYARASLLRYAGWMVEHEVPYFDRPEQLEYPTETWAAQEFRKANVLRLAAAHADEPLRSHLLRRGDELADRAWRDLLGFPSRHTARAAALVLVEGTRDAFFRMEIPPSAPRPRETYDFGRPEVFVPQKQRVLTQLKSPGGMVRALLRLADVRRWVSRTSPQR